MPGIRLPPGVDAYPCSGCVGWRHDFSRHRSGRRRWQAEFGGIAPALIRSTALRFRWVGGFAFASL